MRAQSRRARRLRFDVGGVFHAPAPAIVRMTFSRVMSRSAISPIFCRSRSTAIRSLTATSSSSSDDATSSARPLRAQPADQRHDLGMRADVDAARRLVENEDARIGRPARARAPPSAGCRRTVGRPACRRRASRSPSALIISCGELLLLVARQPPQPAALGLQRQDDVLAHGEFAERGPRPCGLPDRTPCPGAASARANGRSSAAPPTLSRPESGRIAPKISLAISVRPEPSRPGEPDDFAGAQREVERRHRRAAARGPRPRGSARPSPTDALAASALLGLLEFAPEHQRDQLQRRQFGRRRRRRPAGRCAAPRCGRRSR